MLIHVDGKTIEVTEELVHNLFHSALNDAEDKYMKMDLRLRLAIKTMLRTYVFPALEKLLQVPVRPPKEIDPTMFLLQQIVHFVEEASNYASITIQTSESDGKTHRPTALAFSLKDTSESGRQLDFSWSERVGEDNIREETPC